MYKRQVLGSLTTTNLCRKVQNDPLVACSFVLVEIVNVREVQFASVGRMVGIHDNIGRYTHYSTLVFHCAYAVSYTHLDVYKRQKQLRIRQN